VAPIPERPPDAQTAACPCRHGDVPAETAAQRPLLERAAAGDREAFARLYDDQVEGVYRYLVAWTGDRSEAAELTGQVFRGAVGWLPVTAGGAGGAGAWLIAMARDAIAQRRESGPVAGPAGSGPPPIPAAGSDGSRAPVDAVAAVARLRDPQREVVVLRLLLGHSLAHTAHLSGYTRRTVLELQLAACLAVRELTGGAEAGPDPTAPSAESAEELERRLGRWEIDLTGSDPALAGALTAAASLRQAIPGYVVAPNPDLVARLRQELLTTEAPDLPGSLASPAGVEPSLTHPVPGRVPRWGSVAHRGWGGVGLSTGSWGAWLFRRPWVATGVATAGIVVVLALQAFGQPAPPPGPTSTTAAVAAAGTSLGTPLTTVLQPSTTTTTQPALTSATSAPRAPAASAPQTTRPATTAPQTTGAPRPTTTRAPTTTAAPTTTTPPTTTTSAPAPT
jgi:RNA polymerase sigma-70 factor (ECF subfamily)